MQVVATVACNDDTAEAVRQLKDGQRGAPRTWAAGSWWGMAAFCDATGWPEGVKPGQVKW